jgi:putative ABC transport system substrate-binding protein
MRRREFITLLGGAAAGSPLVARAQQPIMPVTGFLRDTVFDMPNGFCQGLADRGFVDSRNVTIEYRSAEGHNERLPALATELVARQVDVVVVNSNAGALAAKAATLTIPIVFSMGGDPVRLGFVASFNRPGGNLTGITIVSDVLIKKRLELVHELVPSASNIAVLLNPRNPDNETRLRDSRARSLPIFL